MNDSSMTYDQSTQLQQDNIKLRDLARLTEKMRWHQREYIRTRDRYDLLDAKRMEKVVDALLEQLKQAGAFSCITITFFLSTWLW